MAKLNDVIYRLELLRKDVGGDAEIIFFGRDKKDYGYYERYHDFSIFLYQDNSIVLEGTGEQT